MQKLFETAAACVVLVAAMAAADATDWPSHGHDAGGQRFSPLEPITPTNVATLQRARTFDTGGGSFLGAAPGSKILAFALPPTPASNR